MLTNYPTSDAVISLSRVAENVTTLKNKSGGSYLMAVVKVNAYGHGAVPCARFLESHVDAFAVATVGEALELRQSGISKELLVFGAPDNAGAAVYRENDITVTVSHKDHFSILKPGTRYHLNFDTGMRRLGFSVDQASDVKGWVTSHPDIQCTGVYSHYAMADEPGVSFTGEQNRLFQSVRELFPDVRAHMSNTAAVLHYKENHFDMIRVGIGLWGYSSGVAQDEDLKPVLEWKSRITQVRPISKDESVSYGRKWTCPADGYLGTIPVGYGDGVPRSLTNRLEVRVGKRMCPVVGAITMDHSMVYLGEESVIAGTEVILMGERAWPVTRWAAEAGSIPHEIFCLLTRRVRRVYRE